jgi:hypothetical protein
MSKVFDCLDLKQSGPAACASRGRWRGWASRTRCRVVKIVHVLTIVTAQ